MAGDIDRDPFEKYIRETEPDKKEKGYAWYTAIGLQAVDGLKTSEYLRNTAVRNIEGEIGFEEAQNLLNNYYKEHRGQDSSDNRSMHISGLLDQKEKADIRRGKADIGAEKADIGAPAG